MQNNRIKSVLKRIDGNRVSALIIVAVMFVIVIYPRFNGQDIALIRPLVGTAPGALSPDQQNYYNFTEYFKGNTELSSVAAPFSYRPAMPFAASLLPFDSRLSMTVVNIVANLLSLLLLYLILVKLNLEFSFRIVGLLLYIVSFPLLYYGSSVYLEPASNFFIYLIVYLVLAKRVLWLPLAFLMASITKEVTIIALPFAIFYMLKSDKSEDENHKKTIIILSLSFILFVVGNLWARITFSGDSVYAWYPGIETALGNLSRAKTYISFILGFGLPGILTCLYYLKNRHQAVEENMSAFLIGTVMSLLLSLYSLIGAYSDGRFIWTGYAFMIVISVFYIRDIAGTKGINRTV